MKFCHKVKKFLKDNKLFWLFFAAIIVIAFWTTLIASLTGNDVCNSGISSFEGRHCGTEGKTMEQLRSEVSNYITWDLTMHPQALVYPAIFQVLHLYDDVYVEYHIINWSSGYQMWVMVPWFTMEIDTYLAQPSAFETVAQVILLLLNFCYYGLLAYVFTRLWKNKKWWGKIIPSLFFVMKGIPFLIFVVVMSLLGKV